MTNLKAKENNNESRDALEKIFDVNASKRKLSEEHCSPKPINNHDDQAIFYLPRLKTNLLTLRSKFSVLLYSSHQLQLMVMLMSNVTTKNMM